MVKSMRNLICLDPRFSTTRLLTEGKTVLREGRGWRSYLFLPEGRSRKGEGGLRKEGFVKGSYKRINGEWYVCSPDDSICDRVEMPDRLDIHYESLPLITVITVVFNQRSYLEGAIESVLNQEYPNVEYIIIDGGSTDGTIGILEEYGRYVDYWVSEGDEGIYEAMNKGLDVALGDWVYFLGADDRLNNVLHKVVRHLDPRLSVVYGDVFLKKRGIIHRERYTRFSLLFHNIYHQSMFYNKEIFKTCRYNLKYKIMGDYELNIKVFDPKRFLHVPLLIAYYNDIDGVSSIKEDLEFNRDRLKIISKSFGLRYALLFAICNPIARLLIRIGLKDILRKMVFKVERIKGQEPFKV